MPNPRKTRPAAIAALRARAEKAEAERDEAKALAAQGRHAGREEALAIIMNQDAEEPFDEARKSYPIGCTGDYGVQWDESVLRDLLDIETPGTMTSLLDRCEAMYWEGCAARDAADQLRAQLAAATALAAKHEQDAKRLDWLADNSVWKGDALYCEALQRPDNFGIRTAIDAAMRKE